LVTVYWLIRGTHEGIRMGMSPTGKTFEISALEIFRFAGAKIAEHWTVVDYTAMFQQLGATQRRGYRRAAPLSPTAGKFTPPVRRVYDRRPFVVARQPYVGVRTKRR
jgi:hypothetical protein